MKFIVTGCDGHLGGRVAEIVSESVAPEDLILTCPFPERLNEEKKTKWDKIGVQVKEANYDDKEGMIESFKGGDRIYIVSSVVIGDIRKQQHMNVVDAAIEAGVKHITYTSFLGANDPKYDDIYVTPDHTFTENYILEKIKGTDIKYNFMRNNLYLDNYVTGWPLISLLHNNEWHSLAQDFKATFVPKDDSARLAAALLLGKGKDNVAYNSCGKERISSKEICELINEISTVQFKYVPEDTDGMYQFFASLGIPKESTDDFSKSPFPWCSTDMVTNEQCVRDGLYDVESNAIAEITGIEPMSAKDLIKECKYIWEEKIASWKDIK